MRVKALLGIFVGLTMSVGASAQKPTHLRPEFKKPCNSNSAMEIIGLPVHIQGGKKVGFVSDLVIEEGQILRYVIGVGGFIGIGERKYAFSPKDVEFTRALECKLEKVQVRLGWGGFGDADEYVRGN